jgi:uncharacterized protein (DUF305 family)
MRPYRRLFISLGLSFIVMFAVMYAMVNALDNVVLNVNQFYMTGLMAAPMLIIMLLTMGSMYPNPQLNRALLVIGVALTVLFWLLIRSQTAVGDRQFLRSMIPHHAGAILMCEQAAITDPRIAELCSGIIESQQREIREMKAILQE